MRKYGKRKYPLGVFLFGVDTIETMTKQNFPKVYPLTTALFHTARAFLNKVMYSYKGLYGDKWLSDKSYFMFPVLEGLKGVIFEMETLQVDSLFPISVKAVVNDEFEHSLTLEKGGGFEFYIPVAECRSRFEIEIFINNSFQTKADRRKLTCLLHDSKFVYQ